MVVLGGWLDLILEVFSNLWFYDSKKNSVRTTEKNHEMKSSQDAALWKNTFSDIDHLHLFQILIISGRRATEETLEPLLDGLHS